MNEVQQTYALMAFFAVVTVVTWLVEEFVLHRFHARYTWMVLGVALLTFQGHILYGSWLRATPVRPLTTIIWHFGKNVPGPVSCVVYFLCLEVAIAAFYMAYWSIRLEEQSRARIERICAPKWMRKRWN